jgi:rod shape-determining protein MreB
MVCVPSGLTGLERRAVEEATLAAGARRAYLMEEPLAGAIGAGLPVGEAAGSMIVDIGGGRSEIAVLALGSMVVSASLALGGYELDDAIVRYVNEQHSLLIGQEQAEVVKLEIGSITPLQQELTTEVAGRDRLTGLLRRTSLNSAEVREALTRPVTRIVEAVKETLDRTPPELSGDIVKRGLLLVGGGALLRGIDDLLRRETGLPVTIADTPLLTVATGAGRSLEEYPLPQRSGDQRVSRTARQRRRSRF